MINIPKISDNLEKIRDINEELYHKYNRHHVMTDKNVLFDPTIDIKTYFNRPEDISGNGGTEFKVRLAYDSYCVLSCLPIYEINQEYLDDQFKAWTKAMETSYEFEDLNLYPSLKQIQKQTSSNIIIFSSNVNMLLYGKNFTIEYGY